MDVVLKGSGFTRVSEALRKDVGEAIDDPSALRRLIETNPVAAWAGAKGTGGVPFFAYRDGVFGIRFSVPPEARQPLHRMVAEIVDWRLADYIKRVHRVIGHSDSFTCKVNQSKGRPILFPLDRSRYPSIPTGPTAVLVDGELYKVVFAKVAVNVVRREGSKENVLSGILRRWFGERAGHPGTNQYVELELRDGVLEMKPVEGHTPSTMA